MPFNRSKDRDTNALEGPILPPRQTKGRTIAVHRKCLDGARVAKLEGNDAGEKHWTNMHFTGVWTAGSTQRCFFTLLLGGEMHEGEPNLPPLLQKE